MSKGNRGNAFWFRAESSNTITPIQNTSLACTHLLRIPLSVKSRFRKRPGCVPFTVIGGTWTN
jgi:hypothetical protein